jgi:hypothetical protein
VWDQAAVIEMRVRQEDRVDLPGIVGQRNAIPDGLVRVPLEHAAIDEHFGARCRQ